MAEEKEAEEKKEGEEAPKKKGKGKLIIIIAVVVVLLGGGAGAFLMMGGKAEEGAEATEEEAHHDTEAEEFERIDLEPIIVNLSENASFLKVKLAIEVSSSVLHDSSHASTDGGGGGHGDAKAGLPGVLGTREPIIKDAMIRVMSSKTAAEVLSNDGKAALKDELIDAVNEATALDEPLVVNIYFTDFIIQ